MFDPTKPFYMTRAIAEELSEEHQQFILQYIHQHHQHLNDYLQIFEFYIEDGEQWLVQRQEQPERETTIFVGLEETEPINEKVWVQDQQDYVIILYPQDY
ncbi:DUF960 family protein [Sporosarcina sp. P33]|uniref:DUF960 family protein n=1 Tax=Sporosarcina sp. P33 TaxID=1930764 RepID=UPI0009C0971B|nr:DUF960 family protein [Sporosarcina sp. P33]ARD48838.1 hypothetical protein SporoP33_11790 [Sporosarcina sp. P33]